MVTEQEIAEAEAAVEVAEARLDAAERYHAEAGGQKSHQEFRVAQAEANGARDRVRRLRSTWARERASEARRAEAERNFPGKRRQALARHLGDARDEAVHAVAALDQAAAVALAAVAEYGATVRQVSGELLGAGLRAGGGGTDGGGTDGVVHLGDEVWRPANPFGVLEYLLAARVAVENPSHPLAMRRYSAESLAGKAAREDLLRAVGR